MMRAVLILAAVLPIANAEESKLPPAPADDPVVGTWKLIPERSTMPAAGRLHAETRTYARVGSKVKVKYDYTTGLGAHHEGYIVECDGKPHNIGGNRTLECQYTASNVLDGMTIEDGEKLFYRREVTSDKREMTLTFYSDPEHTKMTSRRVFERAP